MLEMIINIPSQDFPSVVSTLVTNTTLRVEDGEISVDKGNMKQNFVSNRMYIN